MKEVCSNPPSLKFSYIVLQQRMCEILGLPHISEGLVFLDSCCEIGMDRMICGSFCGYFVSLFFL